MEMCWGISWFELLVKAGCCGSCCMCASGTRVHVLGIARQWDIAVYIAIAITQDSSSGPG